MTHAPTCLSILSFVALLGACESPKACETTAVVRVRANGQEYHVPVEHRPLFFLEGRNIERLPSSTVRDRDGLWAYCQSASEAPTEVESIAFYDINEKRAMHPQLSNVTFLIVGGRASPRRDHLTGNWPVTREAGYEVMRTKGPVYVYRGEREGPELAAHCVQNPTGPELTYCRLVFLNENRTVITANLMGVPLSEWDEKIRAAGAFVRELMPRK